MTERSLQLFTAMQSTTHRFLAVMGRITLSRIAAEIQNHAAEEFGDTGANAIVMCGSFTMPVELRNPYGDMDIHIYGVNGGYDPDKAQEAMARLVKLIGTNIDAVAVRETGGRTCENEDLGFYKKSQGWRQMMQSMGMQRFFIATPYSAADLIEAIDGKILDIGKRNLTLLEKYIDRETGKFKSFIIDEITAAREARCLSIGGSKLREEYENIKIPSTSPMEFEVITMIDSSAKVPHPIFNPMTPEGTIVSIDEPKVFYPLLFRDPLYEALKKFYAILDTKALTKSTEYAKHLLDFYIRTGHPDDMRTHFESSLVIQMVGKTVEVDETFRSLALALLPAQSIFYTWTTPRHFPLKALRPTEDNVTRLMEGFTALRLDNIFPLQKGEFKKLAGEVLKHAQGTLLYVMRSLEPIEKDYLLKSHRPFNRTVGREDLPDILEETQVSTALKLRIAREVNHHLMQRDLREL